MRAFFAEGMIETDEGERLSLVCDFLALKVIEDVSGQFWDDIVPQLADPPRHLAAIVLYGLLRGRQPTVTLDEAAGLFFDKHSAAIWAVMAEVIRRACNIEPDAEEASEKPSKKKPSGRSRSSAKSG